MNDISRPAVVVVMLVATLVQASVVWHFPLFGIVWLPLLQIVTLLALWYGPVGGAGWGFAGGLLLDMFSDAHLGLSALALTVAGFVGGFAATVVQPNRAILAIVTTLWVIVVYFVLLGALLITFEYRFSFRDMFLQMALPTAFVNAVFAPLIVIVGFRFLEVTSGSYSTGRQ
jgi:rod shape-determining protein MreD